jgi:ABC-type branched-subunit amino acid transport system permease subunit
MNLDWLDAFLVYGLFSVMMVIGLGLLLHLQLGLARIANFGIVGFWGIGMYAFGVMYIKVDWPFADIWALLISMAFGTLVAGIAGIVVGWVISDLDIDGVLVGTLGFATCVLIVATTEQDLTGGALGMGGLGFPYDIGSVKANETLWLVILSVIVALILYYVSRVHRAPYGRLLISIGDNEPLARSLGKQSFRTKLWLFAGSSAVMGLLGAIFGVMERFLDIGNLGIDLTLAAMVGLVLGSTTRTWGAVVGVLLTVAVFDIILQSYIPLPQSWYGQAIPNLREMTLGAALILVLMFRPYGVLGPMRRDKLMRRMHGS